MTRHDCNVPNTTAKKWTCPCGRKWVFTQPIFGDAFAELWHGKKNLRMPDGSRIKSWWEW